MDEKEGVNLLAFDIGASSGRAILGNLKNEKLEIEIIHQFPNEAKKVDDSDYWDILNIFNELKKGIKKCANKKILNLKGIGIDTWGIDFVLLDENNQLIGIPHTYRDKRTESSLDKIFLEVSKEEIFDQTGIQFMEINSLNQLFSMLKQESPQLSITKKVLMIPDYLNYLLCGVFSTEYSIATTTQLFNPIKKEWAFNLIDKLGFKREWFAKIVPSASILGKLKETISLEMGLSLSPNIIAPLCHDTGSAVAATPVEMEKYKSGEWAYLSSGTWSLLGVELNTPIINKKSLKYNFTNEGGIAGTIRFLKNITGLWIIQECKKMWDVEGHRFTWEVLIQEANKAESFSCYFNVDDPQFLNPPNMIKAIINYCKSTHQSIINSPGQITRAILENLAFRYKYILEKLEELIESKIKILHIIGGGSINYLLNQFTANSTELPVKTGPSEATAIGNILVQALALGFIKNVVELRNIVFNSFKVEHYTPQDKKKWGKAYQEYLEITDLPL
jgi:rhamnulokinase